MRRTRSGVRGGSRSVLVALPLLLAGCASTAVQHNLAETSAFATREVGQEAQLQSTPEARAAAESRARALLAEPLTADGAVQIALGYSPTFQRMLADSAAASAAATQSARLPNPIFAFSDLSAGNFKEIDRTLAISLLDFVLLPQRLRLADLQQAQHRLRSAGDVIATATEARQAWIDAVAARQSLAYAAQAQKAAEAGAELGRRMAAVGNFSRIEAAREQSFYAEATAELARAQLEAQRTREVLIRLLGLSGDLAEKLTLPDRLPDLPATPDDESVLARRAFDERLDVALARAELDFTARSLGLTRVTSTVNALEVGVASKSTTGEDTLKGYDLELRLPLFDFGDARRANAQAVYLAALNRTAAVIVEAQSHLRESYLSVSHDLRPRPPLPRRNRAATQDHLRREPAALQRHVDRGLRTAGRRARADLERAPGDRRTTRILAGRCNASRDADRPSGGGCRTRSAGRDPRRRYGSAPLNRPQPRTQ